MEVFNVNNNPRTVGKGLSKFILLGVILLAAIILLTSTFGSVPAGYVGITVTMGSVSQTVRNEGMYMKLPFVQTIRMMEARTQKVEWNNPDSPITAASKDLQDVYILAVVTYHISPDRAPKIFQTIGLDYADKKVIPLTLNAIKTHTGKYNVAEILNNREKITNDVNKDVAAQLLANDIILENVSLVNIDFRKEYKDAIEQKQIAEKQVETQQYTLNKQALEAQQQVKKAEADKQAKILAAEAEKQAKILEGEGIEEFNKKVTQSITDQLLKYKELQNQEKSIDKWSGQYPAVVAGGDSIPLIQMPASVSGGGSVTGITGSQDGSGSSEKSGANTGK
ncbi:MAG TPA: SPFH domain-containing protein [Clostridia bacterium]|nr:SPFH domain-containing protein [Clostridia bacterium]